MKYFLGHQHTELERLALQARVLNAITSRLLEKAGLSDGMRVLDIGCGLGDVALLASERVGPNGYVLGIDQNADAVAQATGQLDKSQAGRITFQHVTFEDFTHSKPFDLVVARYVLIHQPDPVAFVHKASRMLRPGGVLAFHEISFRAPMMESQPTVELWQQAGHWITETMRLNNAHYDIASRLKQCFLDAGLKAPAQFIDRHIDGGADSPLYAWATETLRSMVPHLIKAGVLKESEVDLATFEQRLREQAVANNSKLLGPLQVCAWLKLADE